MHSAHLSKMGDQKALQGTLICPFVMRCAGLVLNYRNVLFFFVGIFFFFLGVGAREGVHAD